MSSPRPATVDNAALPTQEGPCSSLYGSTKRGAEFTSENHKLEISNLPPKQDYHLIRHLLERQLKLQPHKIRVGHGKAYVAFASESARDDAIETINNYEWKGITLNAKRAAPRHDPLAKRIRPTDKGNDDEARCENEGEEQADNLNSHICPLWDKPYDEQLKIKASAIRHLLNFAKPISKLCKGLEKESPKLQTWIKENFKIACQFDGVIASPVLEGYRNKCELNIGHDGTVGFRLGRYRDGSEKVVSPPSDCPILNQEMLAIIDAFQTFIKGSLQLKGFDHVTHDGNIRQLTIRTNQRKESLVIVDLHQQELTDEELNGELEKLSKCLTSLPFVKSIYMNVSAKNHLSSTDQTLKLLYGEPYLFEYLNIGNDTSLKFRIGPTSFFQVNTKASELLYTSMIELSGLDSNSLVLDVGCGIGTISLSVAKKVAHVIGIEVVESAVEDAKINARENSISNVSFFAGRAEDLIGESIAILKQRYKSNDSEIVAIVDPPRNGFNNSFIKHLRASNVRKIIYIACDPRANTNLTSLCRPTSKAYRGDPFIPTRAKAFDLFPHTKFCELLLIYERLS